MSKTIQIVGAPVDLGQSKGGVDMGPSAMRNAGLSRRFEELGYKIIDKGNIQVPVKESLNRQKVIPEIIKACENIYNIAKNAVAEKSFPVFLGGDHSISIGSVGGITHDSPAGLIWIDAHGDFNTMQTSSSGNVHGMALAVLSGYGLPELVNAGREGAKIKRDNIVLIGVRNLEDKERKMFLKSGIKVYTMRDIDEHGISSIIKKTLNKLDHMERIHVSLDIDCIDPMTAPGVGIPVPGGLTYREAHLIMEITADSKKISSMDIVEINPILDRENQTAKIAVELAASLFGKSIL